LLRGWRAEARQPEGGGLFHLGLPLLPARQAELAEHVDDAPALKGARGGKLALAAAAAGALGFVEVLDLRLHVHLRFLVHDESMAQKTRQREGLGEKMQGGSRARMRGELVEDSLEEEVTGRMED
jgi:hypothetical protein